LFYLPSVVSIERRIERTSKYILNGSFAQHFINKHINKTNLIFTDYNGMLELCTY